jgi:hypothetical protein
MRVIELNKGRVAIVDDEDFEYLAQWRWHVIKKGEIYYARRSVCPKPGKKRGIYMHMAILRGGPEGQMVDHKNTDGLDNRRCNLRFATKAQNMRNRGKQKNNSTGFKGVSIGRQIGTFRACIKVDKKYISLGQFKTAEEAHAAYCAAAKELHGDFARFN